MAGGPNSRNPLVKSPQQWFFYGVLAVVLVAIGLRFGWLFSLPLTNDETSALMRLQVSGLGELINGVVWNDGHPMLVQVFLWYWTQWFGTAVWVIKLPFLLCGVGAVILMIHIGMRLNRPWAGLMAAAMLATLQFPVMYSEIARPYAPGLLLALWAFYVWLRWVALCWGDSPRMKDLLMPMLLLALAGYLGASNHYFNGLILGLLFVAGLSWLPTKYWLRYLWPWVMMVAFYAHQIGIFMHHLQVGSPGWLSVPTWSTLGKHLLYSIGYSVWIWVFWALIGFGLLVRVWMRTQRFGGTGEAVATNIGRFVPRKKWVTVLLLYLLPMAIAFAYSIYRAPVFQDSVLLFSFPFGLLAVSWWMDQEWLGIRWKAFLLALTLLVNTYVLIVDRRHVAQFGNQSYDGAVRTFQQWGLNDFHKEDFNQDQGVLERDSSEMWVYGFEPFFMEFHATALGWDIGSWQKQGGRVRYFREETDDYAIFRRRLGDVRGDNFYYVNMVGMDPMLRVWIQEAFPYLVREAMGAGYHVMHFSKRGQGKRPLYRTEIASVSGDLEMHETPMSTEQYFPVCLSVLDSLGPKRYEAEFVAEAEVVVSKELLQAQDLRLVVTVNDGSGKQVRFLDRGLGDMDYRVDEVARLDDSVCVVKLYLSGRLVDVPWGAWLNHGCVGNGYQLQAFIDNAGKHPVGVRRIACTFWEGNGDVYGLVNPSIP
jgi:hypothetical protein